MRLDDFAHAPQRRASAERGIGSGAPPGDAALVAGNQRQRCRKRHLEARMHHRFRREQQHHQYGNGHGAERQDRSIEQDADQYDRDHDERALGRDLGTGQHQIERGHEQRRKRRPFLDRRPVGKSGDQRQQRAHDEEHDAGDHGHVIARDRQHVTDAGHKHRIVNMRRNRIALARDQRRGNRADIAGQDGADAQIDRVAQALNEGIDAQPPTLGCGRRHDLDGAVDEAGGAEALEVKVAGEIVAAGP